MKSKIIALLLTVICLAALFAACDNTDSEPTEEPTIEAPTQAPTEEETEVITEEEISEMIVNPMPEGGELKDYLNTKYESYFEAVNTIDQVNIFDASSDISFYDNGLLIVKRVDVISDDEGRVTTVEHIDVYNVELGKKIFTYTSEPYTESSGNPLSCEVGLFADDQFSWTPDVIKITKQNNATLEAQYDYMTFSGTHIATAYEELDVEVDYVNDICYATVGDTVYAIDYDGSIMTNGDKISFVRRPAFYQANDKLAYLISDNNTLYFYNTDKWLDCVYSYQIPGYYDSYKTFMLENGNVLVQALCSLPDDTLSYDALIEGVKTNIDYIILDATAKKADVVEFGYMIELVDVNYGGGFYTDSVQNIFYVYPIVNQKVDDNALIELAVNNTLEIKYNYTKDIPPLCDYLSLIANNRFLTTATLDYDTYIQYIYNEKLEKIATISVNAYMAENYILVENTVYDMSMKPLLDNEDGYVIAYAMSTYVILEKEGVLYFYNPSIGKTVEIVGEGEELSFCDEYIFSVVTAEGKYEIFNSEGKLLAATDNGILTFEWITYEVMMITFENGEIMFAK